MNENIEMNWFREGGKVVSEREMKCLYGEYVAKGCIDPSLETYESWISRRLRSCTTTIPEEDMETYHVYGTALMSTAFDIKAPDTKTAKVEAEFYLNNNEDRFDYETSSWEVEVE